MLILAARKCLFTKGQQTTTDATRYMGHTLLNIKEMACGGDILVSATSNLCGEVSAANVANFIRADQQNLPESDYLSKCTNICSSSPHIHLAASLSNLEFRISLHTRNMFSKPLIVHIVLIYIYIYNI